ncbi:hypothetical protein [Halomarina ordinaria]|uniref:Uncharacterized protein n=1 Tax=Halomarina ordinaria TaxID=3033939 RepID=A0ABD5U6P2_9EURY
MLCGHVVIASGAFVGSVHAHAGSLGGAAPVTVPSWLLAVTGGGAVVASFLFTSVVTDRALVRAPYERGPTVSLDRARTVGRRLLSLVGVLALLAVVVVGFVGPVAAVANLGVLLVWVGWWAGYSTTVYLVGNTWPALDPWRTIARHLPSLGYPYPARLGAWPSVVALLALVWLEVVSPLADAPRLLASVVLCYTLVTLAGASVVGRDVWFDRVDPVSRVFRYYGALAPVQRVDGRLALRVPGAALTVSGLSGSPTDRPRTAERSVRADGGRVRARRLVAGPDDVAFVVALVWVTTFDGLVSTAAWAGVARPLVDAGLPPLAVYLGALVVGFLLALGAFRLAARLARRSADAFVAPAELDRRFVLALVPIAAGYHLAHFLGYFLSLSPALAATLADPLSPPMALVVLVPPAWFGGLQVGFVVLGHLVGVWVAHVVAFETFTGRLQPLRSQYPYVALMVLYTTTSIWLLTQPYARPPFLGG